MARRLILLGLLWLSACAAPPAAAPLRVAVLAINDLHGHLQPPRGSPPGGGIAVLAGALDEARARHRHSVFVAAGDLIGASPLVSSLFHDEPTVLALTKMGLLASAVGNHEFDRGAAELLRLQSIAGFQYLAASTVVQATGRTLLPAYTVARFDGVPVAFIGLTLQATPNIVVPSGVVGLRFDDEVATVNALVPQLRAQGIEAIVLLIHEGGQPIADACLDGPIVPIVKRLHPAVDLVVSGHTHRAYVCRIDGRLVTSAGQYGTLLTEIELVLDRRSKDLLSAQARNTVVDPERFAPHPGIAALVADYAERAVPLTRRVVAPLAAALPRDAGPNGQSPVGRLVADAQLAATRDAGAQIALTNPGGLRAALAPGPDGMLRYEDLFTVQPFRNPLVTMTLSGAQLQQLLEQQWLDQPQPRVLQVSRGFGYIWDARQPPGRRVVAGSLRLDGRPIEPDQLLRVTVNGFLADGGDQFGVLLQGSDRRTGMFDVDALEQYLLAGGRAEDDPRVQRLH